jgi:hypothetical protein
MNSIGVRPFKLLTPDLFLPGFGSDAIFNPATSQVNGDILSLYRMKIGSKPEFASSFVIRSSKDMEFAKMICSNAFSPLAAGEIRQIRIRSRFFIREIHG